LGGARRNYGKQPQGPENAGLRTDDIIDRRNAWTPIRPTCPRIGRLLKDGRYPEPGIGDQPRIGQRPDTLDLVILRLEDLERVAFRTEF
jgi:hypothetical protein